VLGWFFSIGYRLGVFQTVFISSVVASLGLPLRLGSEVIILLNSSMKFSLLEGVIRFTFQQRIELAQATFKTCQKLMPPLNNGKPCHDFSLDSTFPAFGVLVCFF
jgi:hypothetical protein